MAVTVNATGTKLAQTSAVSTIDYSGLTVAAGSNSALVALWMIDDNNTLPSSITATWDPSGANQALTQIAEENANAGSFKAVFVFALAGEHGALATGNKILRFSWTGAVKFFMVGMAFDGVDQTGGVTSFPHATVATAASTISVTSAVGNKVICCESSGAGQGTSTGTLIFDDHTNGSIINAMCQYDDGAASVSIGNNGANACIAGCDILAAAGGAASTATTWLWKG